MVVKKRLDRRFNCFQVPFVPKGPRSARRIPFKEVAKDCQTCAFELLALAGELLKESESSSASSNASEENDGRTFSKANFGLERQDEDRPLKPESICHGSYGNIASKSEVASQNICDKTNTSDCSEKVGGDVVYVNCKTESFRDYCGSVADTSPIGESCVINVGNEYVQKEEGGRLVIGESSAVNNCSLKDPMNLCNKSTVLIGRNSATRAPSPWETIPCTSFSSHGKNIKLGFRDDDDKFSRCNKSGTKSKVYRPPQRIKHRRIRKLLRSKYWKVVPKSKDCRLSRSDMGVQLAYRKRKNCYALKRFHRDAIFKRMRFFEQTWSVTSDGGFSSNNVSNSLDKGVAGEKNGVTELPSSVDGHQSPFHSKDCHVKLSIKSFRVPNLYVEVPETATVGLLKRTVMEAVMGILGDGLHVGVLHQGKKIRDDKKTLLQTGIACEGNLETLGFTLESTTFQSPQYLSSVDPAPQSSCEEPQPLTTFPRNTELDLGTSDVTLDCPLLKNTCNVVESNHNSLLSHTDTTTDIMDPDSRALVVVPERSNESLAVVPVNQKTRHSDNLQRRTRRPFSVSEVEALVRTVEELGTGRWRDVKLRAFENADHRTYVDLKDKWKTLVHTAKISPQQRRGAPVPQELLNRVLGAHTYWSQSHQQARQHGKHETGTLRNGGSSLESVEGSIQLVEEKDEC